MLKFLALFVICGLLPGAQLMPSNHVEKFSPKIIEGENANEGEYPYMVSFRAPWAGQNDSHVCGGAILTNKWVITGGFCCYGLNTGLNIYLRSGSNQLSQQSQSHKIAQYVIHENYSIPTGPEYDICLVQIEDEFEFDDDTQEVSLPLQGFEVNAGDLATVTGWGTTNPAVATIPDVLQAGKNFTVVANNVCTEITNLPLNQDFFLCAKGNPGQSICAFDFGDPLVKDGVLIGVASYYGAFCTDEYPDVYARVPYFIDWIQGNLGEDAKNLKFSK